MCAAVPTLAPKDRDRCAFFPLGCTSLGFWMLKDFDAAMITSAARSMPTVGWTHIRTYVPMSAITVFNYVCICVYMYTYVCTPYLPFQHTRYSTYMRIHGTPYLSHSNTHCTNACTVCMYTCTYVRMYVHITGRHQGVTWTCQHCSCLCTASSDTMRTYVRTYVCTSLRKADGSTR